MGRKDNAIGLPATGSLRAKQIRGAPEYPVQNLYPCSLKPENFVYWLFNAHWLTEGIYFHSDGHVSYAPAMVARMRIASFRVHVQIDGFDEACCYRLRLLYSAKSNEVFEQVSTPQRAVDRDEFVFDVPLEHLNTHGWFTCVLHVELLTPMPAGKERQQSERMGVENPHMPVLIRGAYLEVHG